MTSLLADSLKAPHLMTFPEFVRPVPIPSVRGGYIRVVHVTSVPAFDDIIREGLLVGKSRGVSNREPTVVWTTAWGKDIWGGKLTDQRQRAIIFEMPATTATRMGTDVYVFRQDIPVSAFLMVNRPGYSSVSGWTTVREERECEEDEARLFWEAYRKDAGLHEGMSFRDYCRVCF